MKTGLSDVTIDGKKCKGEASITILKNNGREADMEWTGVVKISKDAFADDWREWRGREVFYEGVFEFAGNTTGGKGRAVVDDISQSNIDEGMVILNLRSSGEFELEDEIV